MLANLVVHIIFRIAGMFARSFVEDDVSTLRGLHEAWYPLRYAPSFYNTLVDGRADVWTSVIVSPTSPERPQIDARWSAAGEAFPGGCGGSTDAVASDGGDTAPPEAAQEEPSDADGVAEAAPDEPAVAARRYARQAPVLSGVAPTVAQKEGRDEMFAWSPPVFDGYVAAAISARLVHMSACEDAYVLSDILGPDATMFYIQTLGTSLAFRRQKLASHLVWRCIEKAVECRECDAVYLHVISYNVVRRLVCTRLRDAARGSCTRSEPYAPRSSSPPPPPPPPPPLRAMPQEAMTLYKRCGFQMVQFLEGFYVIDGVSYSSYLYILYLDELRHPPSRERAQQETPPADAATSRCEEGGARSPGDSPGGLNGALAAPAQGAAGNTDDAALASSSGATCHETCTLG